MITERVVKGIAAGKKAQYFDVPSNMWFDIFDGDKLPVSLLVQNDFRLAIDAPMSFFEAINKAKDGVSIKRLAWGDKFFINVQGEELMSNTDAKTPVGLNLADFTANDWVIVEAV